jgi:hypothetical protein
LPLPTPHPGLVISYSYLWQGQHRRGEEEGRKDRPCAIVLVRQIIKEACIVSVVPVTHSPPSDPADAVVMPPGLKRHLGLDDQPSWIVISELNDFVWPGPDLRPICGKSDRYDYGVLPPSFFRKLQEAIFTRINAKKLAVIARTE